MSFMGTYQNNVDPKGRVSIPVKYREALGERFFVTKGFDSCIDIYTVEEWEKFAEKLHKLSVTKRDMRDFVRFIFGNATEVELDKQGRILLTIYQKQKEHTYDISEWNNDLELSEFEEGYINLHLKNINARHVKVEINSTN